MDLWDPLLLDDLASKRPVVIFDQPGIGRSGGSPADTFQGWADNTIALVDALGYKSIDLLGFSMGGCAVQMVALTRPELIHKLIIGGSASSEPSSVPQGIVWPREVPTPEEITALASAPNDVAAFKESLIFSFFPHTEPGRKAGEAYFQRLYQRDAEEMILTPLGGEGTNAQLASWGDFCKPNPKNAFDRLGELEMPVLVLNGDNDLLVPTSRSYELLKFIENAQLIMYPRSGHGFIWQYAQRVAEDVNKFLDYDL